jgi:glutaredoxin
MADAIKQLTGSQTTIVVFAASWCGFCKKVLQALEAAGIEAHVVDVDNTAGISDALRAKTGKTSVPQCFIGDKYIG